MDTPEDKTWTREEFGDEITSDLTPFVYPTENPVKDATPVFPCKKWKSGDVARLKSGGPLMTVDRYQTVCDYTTMPSSANGTTAQPAGEEVRCVYFFGVESRFVCVHEDALVTVKGGTVDE